jgi:hypothetical protein
MAFSWTNTVSPGEVIENEIYAEIYDNLDSLYNSIDRSDLITDRPDINDYDLITNEVLTDIKDEVVVIDELNYCRTHYDNHRIADYVTYNVDHDADQNTSEKSDHDSTHQSTHYATHDDTHNTTKWISHNVTHDVARCLTEYTDHDTSELASHDQVKNQAQNSGVQSVKHHVYLATHKANVQKVNRTGYNRYAYNPYNSFSGCLCAGWRLGRGQHPAEAFPTCPRHACHSFYWSKFATVDPYTRLADRRKCPWN